MVITRAGSLPSSVFFQAANSLEIAASSRGHAQLRDILPLVTSGA